MATKRRQYGSGSVYKFRDKYAIKWYLNGKPNYIYNFNTKKEAENALKSKNDHNYELTIGNYYEKWIEKRKITNKSYKDDEYRWGKHLSYLNDRLPSSIIVADIKTLVEDKLIKGLSPSTIRLIIKLLSSFFNDLVENQVLSSNIISKLPKSVKRLYRPIYDWASTPFLKSLDDIDKILNCMTGDLQLAYIIASHTGMRSSEVLGLRWEDLDLINKRITVSRQLQNGKLVELKDKESRTIPILNKLLPYLNKGTSDLLFNNMTKTKLRKGLKLALRQLNMPNINWYQATRHSYSAHQILNGCTIERLAQLLGHSSIATTMRYSHFKNDLFNNGDLRRFDRPVI